VKNNLKTLSIIFAILFIFAGCASVTPPQNEYRLSDNVPIMETNKTRCASKTLKVQRAISDNLFMTNKMYYVEGKYTQYAYSESSWIQNINTQISQNITKFLREMNLFKSVQNAQSRTKNDLSLEITIEDFMHYFDKNGKDSYVNVVLTFSFVNLKTHEIYATKTFKSKLKTQTDNALGGVKSLDKALYNVLAESGLWIQGICLDK